MRTLAKCFFIAVGAVLLIVALMPSSTPPRPIQSPQPESEPKIVSLYKWDEKEVEATRKANKEARDAAVMKATAGLRKKRDEVEKITFYMSPEVKMGSGQNYWVLYLAVPDLGAPYLRFRWQYAADDWLFIQGVTLSIDGTKSERADVGHFSVDRDHSGDQIWEWRDEPVNDTDLSYFDKLANSKKTIIRYHGDKYRADRTLSDREKKGFKRMLQAYGELQKL